jgi:DnaK suppressor protein
MNATVTKSGANKAVATDMKKRIAKKSSPSTTKPSDKRDSKGLIEPDTILETAVRQEKENPEKPAKFAIKSSPETGSNSFGKNETSKEGPIEEYMSGNNARADLRDKIEKPVVSKVSEVATKTTKPTPDVPADGALLTEAQILKMGDKDYMNNAQLAFFKARLQQLEKDLLKNADETTEHLRETVLVPDPADRATIEEEHALELRTRDRERKLLKKVQQAIASIDTGDYGWCEETGEPIGIPRLLARPTATLSLEAQQRRELKQKLYGD